MSGLRPALSTFIFLLLITGGVYPLLTTVLGQWWFPWQANGSLIREGDTVRFGINRAEFYRQRLFSWSPVGNGRNAL